MGGHENKLGHSSLVHDSFEAPATPTIPGKRSLTEQLPPIVQRRSDPASGPGKCAEQTHEIAAQGVAGAGSALPHADAIQRSFGAHDVSGIQAHTGGAAHQASHEIGAQAYAMGDHVAFAGTPDLHTAAHEAAHVVQQRGGVHLKGGAGEAGDTYEQHADQVADAVVQGKSAEGLLDRMAGGSGGGAPVVQREDKPGQAKQQQSQQASRGGRLIHLLTTTRPRADEEMDEAYAFLSSLDMPDLLATVDAAADGGYLPQLIARSNAAAWFGRTRLLSAIYTVELAHAPTKDANDERLRRAGTALDQLPQDQQLQVVEYLLRRSSSGVDATTLLEGVLAMREQETAASTSGAAEPGTGAGSRAPAGDGGSAHSAAGPTAGVTLPAGNPGAVEPGPWAPPGNQPIPLYIGNEAHKGIAAEYLAMHSGDVVRSNYVPVSIVLRALEEDLGRSSNAGALSETELGLVPDIVNLTRLHLYEIKPLAGQALGAAKASLYVGLFGRAGVAMQPGPTGEPGTSGGVPAPGGVYMFWSPEPGVIVYQYRKGRLVPVPVAEPEPAMERRWRFELQPLSPQQKQAITTITVGTGLLLIAMILLSPVGI